MVKHVIVIMVAVVAQGKSCGGEARADKLTLTKGRQAHNMVLRFWGRDLDVFQAVIGEKSPSNSSW